MSGFLELKPKSGENSISSCSTCAKANVPSTLPSGKLGKPAVLHVPQWPWSHTAVDLIRSSTLPKAHSHSCCHWTFLTIPALLSPFNTTELLFNHVFWYFGLPECIASDCGVQFISQVWRSLMEKLGITVSLTSRYHPQSNSQAEQINQVIGRFLRTLCADNQENWSWYPP